MALIGEQNQSAYTTMPFDRRKEALTLDGEGSCVVGGITMDQQQGSAQFVCIHKGRHRIVDLRDLPVGTGLRLETEGGQGAVVAPLRAIPALNRWVCVSRLAVMKPP